MKKGLQDLKNKAEDATKARAVKKDRKEWRAIFSDKLTIYTEALSDAQQQEFKQGFVDDLVEAARLASTSTDKKYQSRVSKLKKEYDAIDRKKSEFLRIKYTWEQILADAELDKNGGFRHGETSSGVANREHAESGISGSASSAHHAGSLSGHMKGDGSSKKPDSDSDDGSEGGFTLSRATTLVPDQN